MLISRRSVVSLTMSFTSCLRDGLGRDWCWRRPCLLAGVLVEQFQCRLFRLDPALLFGELADS